MGITFSLTTSIPTRPVIDGQSLRRMLAGGQANLSRLTSNTAWFIQTDAPEGLKLMSRRKLEKSMEGDFETDSMRYKATERYSISWTDSRALYGTAGL